jgi:hypothetical protein
MPSASTPGVGTIEPATRETTTIREQLDAHRKSPVCANCHRMIDPPGFIPSTFTQTSAWSGSTMRCRRTIGVLPM